MLHRRRDRGVDGADAVGEIAGRFDGLVERVCGHRLVSSWAKLNGGLESFSTRRTWRSPAKSVARKAVTHALAMSMTVSRAPIETTLARSEERLVGKECVSTCRSRLSAVN